MQKDGQTDLSARGIRRARYDKTGSAEDEDRGFDAALFFSALFGDEAFAPYVGTIGLAQLGAPDQDPAGSCAPQGLPRRDRQRGYQIVFLAVAPRAVG